MKLAALCLLALCWQSFAPDAEVPRAEPRFFEFRSAVNLPAASEGRACAVLPAHVFTGSRANLNDLRLYAGAAELPYAITESKSTLEPADTARVLNLGEHAGRISFDLQMPARAYTEVQLSLAGQNFLATAQVAGEQSPGAAEQTSLGQFTLFDLAGQHLSRNTTLPLPESSFPFLHVELAVSAAPGFQFSAQPGMVTGAEVPPNLEAQTLYTPVASTTAFLEHGRDTFAAIALPAHVPVERVRFAVRAGDRTNFSRSVNLAATPVSGERDGIPFQPERLDGEISRVHLPPRVPGGQPIDAESLAIAATLGANLQRPASVEVAVHNGDDRAVPFASVTLEMRERKLCFDIPASGEPVSLLYGDPALPAPVYDYSRLFNPADPASKATLGPERPNPGYTARPLPARAFTERHPAVLWFALLAVVAALGLVALRQSRSIVPRS